MCIGRKPTKNLKVSTERIFDLKDYILNSKPIEELNEFCDEFDSEEEMEEKNEKEMGMEEEMEEEMKEEN